MDINYESVQEFSIYDTAMDSRWFSVNRYYSITYPYRDMVLLHAHTETEVMYVVSGKCTINLEGGHVHMQEGDAIFLDSLVPHSLTVEEGSPCRVLNLEASLVQCASVIQLATLAREESFQRLRESRLPWFHVKDEDSAIQNGILNLHRLLQQQGTGMESDFQLSLILLEMSRLYFQDRMKKPQGKPTYVKNAILFIRDRFDSEISIDHVANAVGISKAHLQRSFSKYEGCTIVDAINRLRLEKARFLLVTSDIPIVEIANEVGFSSRQYFSSLFSRATGVSPAEFRRHQRGNMAQGFNGADMGVKLSS